MRNPLTWKRILWLSVLLMGGFFSSPCAAADEFEQHFVAPPTQFGPSCFWWWFGCPYSIRDIHNSLDAMKAAGLGGFRIYPIYTFPDAHLPAGVENFPYLSPQYLERVRESVRYAGEIGLQAETVLGTGWPFGGPYIPSTLGAGQLKFASLEISGPRDFSGPVPGRMTGAEILLAVQAAKINGEGGIDLETLLDLTSKVQEWRLENWHIPPGPWKLMSFVGGYTGMKVKRAAPGGEGLVLDHFNRTAMEMHLKHNGDNQAPSLKGAHAVTMDSWEVFGSNWTPALPVEFQKRRGYSLLPYLSALFLSTGDAGRRIRYDFRKTVSELALENCFAPLKDWAHRQELKTRVEAHGTPADILEAYGLNDIPEAETYGPEDRRHLNIRDRKLASSAGHLFGRNQISCESFTWLRFPLFLVTLENMKAAADAIYLDGINQVNFHGVPFSPSWAESPGWYYYAATNVSPGNTWWPHLKHLSDYLRRTNFLLQQGSPVSDVAVYLPYEDVWADAYGDWFDLAGGIEARFNEGGNSSITRMLEALQDGGYDFDFINAGRLKESKLEGKFLKVGPMRYRVLVLPGLSSIEPESLQRLREFCLAGGVVVGTDNLPARSPGFQNATVQTNQVHQLVNEIFGDSKNPHASPWLGEPRARGNRLGEGEGIFIPRDSYASLAPGTHLLPRLVSKVISPDLVFDSPDSGVGFVHRNAGDKQIYFVANVCGQEKSLRGRYRVSGLYPWLFDAESGAIKPLHTFRAVNNFTEVEISLQPWGSAFIVFNSDPVDSIVSANLSEISRVDDTGKRAIATVTKNGIYQARTAEGVIQSSVENLPAPLAVTGPWNLSAGRIGKQLEKLTSWTDYPEFENFSGTAAYRCEIDIPGIFLMEGRYLNLNLGEVRDIAEVWMNGKLAGIAWKHPFMIDVTNCVKAGKNQLEIRVTNCLANQMRLKPALPPPYSDLKDRIPAPVSSGLLGPVWLRPSQRVVLSPSEVKQ